MSSRSAGLDSAIMSVEIEVLGGIKPGITLAHVFQNGTCGILVQFVGLEDVAQMLGDGWALNGKDLCDLFLREPDGFPV